MNPMGAIKYEKARYTDFDFKFVSKKLEMFKKYAVELETVPEHIEFVQIFSGL